MFHEEVFYLEPNVTFPKPNLLPSHYLGIAHTTSDAFTFYVLTKNEKGKEVVLTQRIIQKMKLSVHESLSDYGGMELEHAKKTSLDR